MTTSGPADLPGAGSLPGTGPQAGEVAGQKDDAVLPGVHARPMTASDLPVVAMIEACVYPFPWSVGNFADAISAGYDCWAFVRADAVGPEALVAYAIVMWIPDDVHLLNLSVAASMQRQGVGRAVLSWLCANTERRGAQGMLLEVRPSNLPAIALYEQFGFSRIGVRRRYYPAAENSREDAWVLLKRFASNSQEHLVDPHGRAQSRATPS